jgi:hypothetical protein
LGEIESGIRLIDVRMFETTPELVLQSPAMIVIELPELLFLQQKRLLEFFLLRINYPVNPNSGEKRIGHRGRLFMAQ